MLKIKRKEKEKTERTRKSTQTRLQGFNSCQLRVPETSPPSQGKKYKICSICEYYVTINHATHRLKRNTSRTVSNAKRVKKKSDVNRANIFCRKKFKAEESVTVKSIFSSVADFRDVVSVLPAARLIKTSRIFVALQKANRPSEIKKSFLVF